MNTGRSLVLTVLLIVVVMAVSVAAEGAQSWAVQLVDGEGGVPIGPKSQSLTVCPGSWVRFSGEGTGDLFIAADDCPGSCPICEVQYGSYEKDFRFDSEWTDPFGSVYIYGMYHCGGEDVQLLKSRPTWSHSDGGLDDLCVRVKGIECPTATDCTGGSGCGCQAKGGTISIDAMTGRADAPVSIPGAGSSASPLRVCGDEAVLESPVCSCPPLCFHKIDNNWPGTWVCDSDPTVTFFVSGGHAVIILADGTIIQLDRTGDSDWTGGSYYVTSVSSPSGQITTFTYDQDTGALTGVALPDGESYAYASSANSFMPTDITYPDGQVRMHIDYAEGIAAEKPTAVIIQDLGSSAHSETDYGYDAAGRITLVTAPSGLRTSVHYTGVQATLEATYNINEGSEDQETHNTTYTLYSRTDFSYSTEGDYEVSYGVTEARQYANPGTVVVAEDGTETFSATTDPSDKITRRYYYQSGYYSGKNIFLRGVKQGWYDGPTFTEESSTVYTVCLDSGWEYGKVESVEDAILGRTTTYAYYNPDENYDVQVQDPELSPGTAKGNGKMQSETLTVGSIERTTNHYYKITGTGTTEDPYVMKPFQTRVQSPEGNNVKYEVNSAGQVVEEYRQINPTSQDYVHTKSCTYYPSGTEIGMLHTETAYAGATEDSNKDIVTHYDYDFDYEWQKDQQTTIHGTLTTVTCDGKSDVSFNDDLGQLRMSQRVESQQDVRQTDYEYDYRGLRLTTTFPQVGEEARNCITNDYLSCCGLLDWSENENSHKTHYKYDGMGRVLKQWTDIQSTADDTNDPLVEYVYGSFGQKTHVKTRVLDGQTAVVRDTEYQYDLMGRVEKVIYPSEEEEGDLLGNEEYTYDSVGRMDTKTDGEGSVTKYQYDDLGRVTGVDYDYDTTFTADISYTYDEVTGRMTDATVDTDSGLLGEENDVTAHYTYDRLGRILTYTPNLPVGYGTISYTWNNLGQKTSMTVPLGYGDKGRTFEYTYDLSGRQIGMDVVPATVTSDTSTPVDPGSGDTRFYYDANQNRAKMVNKEGHTYYFVYDPTARIPAVVYEQVTTAYGESPVTKTYLNIREPSGALVSREKYEVVDGTRLRLASSYTYHADGLGSTIAMTSDGAAVTDRYSYDAWGNVTGHTDPNTGDGIPLATDNPYQYAGLLGYYTHHQESTLGLLQLGTRYYDPLLGRFTQPDAYPKVGESRYLYAGARPLNATDPSGKWTVVYDWNWLVYCRWGLAAGVILPTEPGQLLPCEAERGDMIDWQIYDHGTCVDSCEAITGRPDVCQTICVWFAFKPQYRGLTFCDALLLICDRLEGTGASASCDELFAALCTRGIP